MIEQVGNKVPHPVIMFLYLIAVVAVLSTILAWLDVSVTEEVAVPVPIAGARGPPRARSAARSSPYDIVTDQIVEIPEYTVSEQTFEVRSLLSDRGHAVHVLRRSSTTSPAFGVVAVTLVAMAGVGVAEKAGMMGALIRKLVKVAPAALLGFILIFVGVLSSVASDAGYLILIPLGAAAFVSVGRHPLAGHGRRLRRRRRHLRRQHPDHARSTACSPRSPTRRSARPAASRSTITANYYFAIASSIAAGRRRRVVTPADRRAPARPVRPADGRPRRSGDERGADEVDEAGEARGLRFALYGLLVMRGR